MRIIAIVREETRLVRKHARVSFLASCDCVVSKERVPCPISPVLVVAWWPGGRVILSVGPVEVAAECRDFNQEVWA